MITPTYRTQLQQVCEPWTQAPTARKSTGTTREAQVHTAQAKSPLDMNYEPLTAKWPERLRLLPWEEWKYPCRIQNESEMWKRRGRTHSSDVAVRSLQFTHILYMICFQIANHWHYGWRMIGTMWGPQVIRWFINLINYRYLRIINQLSYLGGLTLCVYIYTYIQLIDINVVMKLPWSCIDSEPPSEGGHQNMRNYRFWWLSISKSTDKWAESIPIFESNSWDLYNMSYP